MYPAGLHSPASELVREPPISVIEPLLHTGETVDSRANADVLPEPAAPPETGAAGRTAAVVDASPALPHRRVDDIFASLPNHFWASLTAELNRPSSGVAASPAPHTPLSARAERTDGISDRLPATAPPVPEG